MGAMATTCETYLTRDAKLGYRWTQHARSSGTREACAGAHYADTSSQQFTGTFETRNTKRLNDICIRLATRISCVSACGAGFAASNIDNLTQAQAKA